MAASDSTRCGEWQPELVILDLMLPELDGYEVLAAIRKDRNRVPVIILTARGEEADKVRGFRLDADQYVTKPFGVLELLERVGALLRRSSADGTLRRAIVASRSATSSSTRAARTVRARAEPCTLTPKAFDLLLALIDRKGRCSPRSTAEGGVGIRRVRAVADGRFARRGAASKARGGSGASEARPDGVEVGYRFAWADGSDGVPLTADARTG